MRFSPLLTLVLLLPHPAFAAGLEVTVQGEFAYDDNLFLLDDGQATDLDDGTSSNDRYDNMESSTDLIVGLSGRVEWSTKELAGRRTRLRLEPGVAVHLRNARCTHAMIGASVDQRLWKGGGVYLRGDLVPSRFKKNYFVDGTDTDLPPDGVSGSEKDYEPGLVTEAVAMLGVSSDIGKRLEVHLEGGGAMETWAKPLQNRDQRLLIAEAGAEVKLGRIKVGAAYELVDSSAPGGDEVVITDRQRDEIPIDRSFSSGKVLGSLDVELTKALELRGAASFRQRNYSSDGALDPYADRVDQRIGFAVGVRMALGHVDLGAGVEHSSNGTKRPNDPDRSGDRQLDYAKNIFSLSASYRF